MATIEKLLHEAYTHWDDGARLSHLGQEIHDRNRLDHAQRVLERVVELAPDDVEAWAHLSYAYFRALDDEKGRAVLRKGVETTGSDALKSTLLNFTDGEEAERLRGELESSSDPGARAGRISERFWAGEKEEALAELRQLIEDNPGEDGPRETLLWMMIRAKHSNAIEGLDLHDEAIPIADERIARSRDRVSAWSLKLMMLAAEKDWDGVLETTAKALEVFPDEETVMQFRARAFREKEDEDRAIQWYQRAVGAKPTFAGARIELAKLYEKQEKLEIAEEVFRDLLVANPDYPFSPVSLALFLARREQWEEAERLMVDVWPSFPEFLRGAVLDNPDAKPLLDREAVKAVIGAEVGAS